MAAKYLELNEAAKLLGLSAEQVMEMREKGEIHGYKDGASWKFKPDEVERVKGELAGGGSSQDAGFDTDFDHLMPSDLPEDEASGELDSVSIEVSDEALGRSSLGSPNTVIGEPKGLFDDEISLEEESKPGSDLKLADLAGSSDLKLASGESGILSAKEAQPKSPEAGGTGDLLLASEPPAALGSDALKLGGSDAGLLDDGDLSLSEDSDDLVLGGSGIGSDVSLDPAGSGINLARPDQSGLSLEDPLILSSDSQGEGLELPEDEEMVLSEDSVDPEQATMLKDDFDLTPGAVLSDDESSDSGSQVIPLVEMEGFGEEGGFVEQLEGGAEPMMEAGPAAGDPGFGMGPGVAAITPMTGPAPTPANFVPMRPPEASYSIFNILGLLSVLLVMGLTGMLMMDVLRNMWAYDEPTTISTGVMDMILEALPTK